MLALVPPSGWFAEELRPGQDCDGDGDVNIACMRSLESLDRKNVACRICPSLPPAAVIYPIPFSFFFSFCSRISRTPIFRPHREHVKGYHVLSFAL